MHTLQDDVILRHGARLRGRTVQPPMQSYSGLKGGFVSPDTINYYGARSKSASMVIVEYTYVSESGGPCGPLNYPEQLAIYSDEHIHGMKELAAAIKKDGNKAILQIHHGGNKANFRAQRGQAVYGPSTQELPFLDYPIVGLTDEQVKGIIYDFGEACRRAIEAGFDGVEIHGAHHYLLQQFFSKTTNQRDDAWGGDLERRSAFPLAVVREVKDVIERLAPKDFILGYRISPDEIHGKDIGYTWQEATELVKNISQYELDYLHLSLWDGVDSVPQDTNIPYAKLFREALDEKTQLVVTGQVFGRKAAQEAIENYCDLVGMGRQTLVDPLVGEKFYEGKDSVVTLTPEQLLYKSHLTPGLFEAFTRPDALGLPQLPGAESCFDLHQSTFDK